MADPVATTGQRFCYNPSPALLPPAGVSATTRRRLCYNLPAALLQGAGVSATTRRRLCYNLSSDLLQAAAISATIIRRLCYNPPLSLLQPLTVSATSRRQLCYKSLDGSATNTRRCYRRWRCYHSRSVVLPSWAAVLPEHGGAGFFRVNLRAWKLLGKKMRSVET